MDATSFLSAYSMIKCIRFIPTWLLASMIYIKYFTPPLKYSQIEGLCDHYTFMSCTNKYALFLYSEPQFKQFISRPLNIL
jgi:hypothetical protein